MPPPDPPAASGAAPPGPQPAPARLRAAANARGVSLAVLAVLACVFTLHWARDVFIPLMLGLTCSYALTPLVNRLERGHVPRVIGATLVITVLLGAFAVTVITLRDDAETFIDGLPAAAQKIRQAARAESARNESALEKVQKAATQLEKAAKASVSAPPAQGVTRVQVESGALDVKDYLWTSLPSMAMLVAQATVVLFITFFLLTSGDAFRRKLVALAGPTLARRRITIEALDEITAQIQRYLRVQVLVSLIVGVATALAFAAVGLEHAAVWGVIAAVLNLVPYLGSIVLIAASTLAAFVQFGNLDMALLVAVVSLVVHTITGQLLTPWLTSRSGRMSPVVVFVTVVFFGWLWGMWGLLLGVPMLMMVKAVCDRVEDLKPIGELLGD